MELRHLKYFVAVAEELNFARAARRVHIAQPSLTKQIQQLEQELGFPLLYRTKKEVELFGHRSCLSGRSATAPPPGRERNPIRPQDTYRRERPSSDRLQPIRCAGGNAQDPSKIPCLIPESGSRPRGDCEYQKRGIIIGEGDECCLGPIAYLSKPRTILFRNHPTRTFRGGIARFTSLSKTKRASESRL